MCLLLMSALVSYSLANVSGEPSIVRKAVFDIASRLHNNPSRPQHMLSSTVPPVYGSSGLLIGSSPAAPIRGFAPVVGSYGGGYRQTVGTGHVLCTRVVGMALT
ncbi:hypothetical protein Dimus_022184 [Dionaea muscipula]